ncbi:hypothetical protein D3C76_1140780 [compost metagenome]
MKQLQEAGLFDVNATNTNYDQASSLFYTGNAAMFINGQWEIYSSQEKMGDNVDFMYWPAKDAQGYAQAVNSTEISNAIDDNAQSLLVNGFTVDDFVNNMNRILKK